MKQFLTGILIATLGAVAALGIFIGFQNVPKEKKESTILGAPVSNVLRNINPEANDTYNIGTSSPSLFWKTVFTNQASTSAISITRTLFVGGTASTTGTATTTIVGANATSTFSGGIRLTGGCFELSTGSCAGGGVSTYLSLTDTQSAFTANRIIHTNSAGTALTDTANFVFTGTNFGIATATPGTLLSIAGAGNFTATTTASSLIANSSLFVGTSSQYRFRVLESGNVGLGATSTESILSIQNSANFYQGATSTIYNGLATPLLRVTSKTASSTFEGGIVVNGGLQLVGFNCSGLTSNGSLTTDANGNVYCDPDDGGGGAVTVNSGTAFRPAYYSGATTIDAATNILLTNAPPAIAISTSSSRFAFTIATSSTRDSAFGYSEEYDKGTATASPINVDWRASNQQRVTLGLTAVTVEFDNIPAGGSGVLVVCQDASGGRDIAVWPVEVLWSGGASTTQSSSPNACDLFGFRATRATSTPTSVRRVIYRGEASISE